MILNSCLWEAFGSRTISEATQQQVDAEVRRIIDEAVPCSSRILKTTWILHMQW